MKKHIYYGIYLAETKRHKLRLQFTWSEENNKQYQEGIKEYQTPEWRKVWSKCQIKIVRFEVEHLNDIPQTLP